MSFISVARSGLFLLAFCNMLQADVLPVVYARSELQALLNACRKAVARPDKYQQGSLSVYIKGAQSFKYARPSIDDTQWMQLEKAVVLLDYQFSLRPRSIVGIQSVHATIKKSIAKINCRSFGGPNSVFVTQGQKYIKPKREVIQNKTIPIVSPQKNITPEISSGVNDSGNTDSDDLDMQALLKEFEMQNDASIFSWIIKNKGSIAKVAIPLVIAYMYKNDLWPWNKKEDNASDDQGERIDQVVSGNEHAIENGKSSLDDNHEQEDILIGEASQSEEMQDNEQLVQSTEYGANSSHSLVDQGHEDVQSCIVSKALNRAFSIKSNIVNSFCNIKDKVLTGLMDIVE